MNLSFMSVGNKQINPGLTYFVLTAAELDFINLPCTKSPSSKAELQNVRVIAVLVANIWQFWHHSPLTAV